ncbi:Uncharacterised protein [Mycobacteroides abscessus subsp. abscessus]|uniref:hypothetical protein n=1 Tax=Mycobacteroides abscessus TaxID=36809 RepID=UPI00092AB5B9|nr:hypothetical protein [Mycobacteroides abscessus]SIJ21074.1 Uncharacterised protein [Mycobacteroides abscessus subsp. abscessus]SLH39351.1 Uncharacterised protein [Mycobacteroides abscessus subsp. abscessus]
MNSHSNDMYYEDGRTPKFNVDPRVLDAVEDAAAQNQAAAQRPHQHAPKHHSHNEKHELGQAINNRPNDAMPPMPQVPPQG